MFDIVPTAFESKRQMAQDYLANEMHQSLACRHDLSRNLIRIWIQKFEAAADTIEAHEARIAALECQGQLTLRTRP